MKLQWTLLSCCLLATAALAIGGSDLEEDTEAECLPVLPPGGGNPNAPTVALQMHQWVWIENLTSPDFAPRTNVGGLVYEWLRPGVMVNMSGLITRTLAAFFRIRVSFVTDGNALCAAALTYYKNETSDGETIVRNCNQVCQTNFTVEGATLSLPLVELTDWTILGKFSEYMRFDWVHPDSRASYRCLGRLRWEPISNLPGLLNRETRCPEGDMCLFNLDTRYSLLDAGCKSKFSEHSWCVSDMDLCTYTYNIEGECPVCCKGDLCNKQVAEKAYEIWSRGAGVNGASSGWLLTAVAIGVLVLRLRTYG